MAEDDFNVQAKDWAYQIESKFGKTAGEDLLEVIEDLFESKEELLADLEVDEWDESALMDTLHSDKATYKDAEMCKTFYKILKSVIAGKYDRISGDAILLPSDLMWDIDEKDIVSAQKYMNSQCPGGGFSTSFENQNLFKIIAVGQKNQIELLTLIMDIYELAHVDEIITKRRGFKNETAWAAKCLFFKTYNKQNGDIIRRAIPEFKKRISGGGPIEMIMNPIQDNINIYIKYVLMINNIIKNIMDSHPQSICPLQIDLVILGRNHDTKKDDHKQEKEEEEENDDDDDDDDENFMAKINASVNAYDSCGIPLVNTLPNYGIHGILERKKIDFIKDKISLNDIATTSRTIQGKIINKIGKNNVGQRIIVCIDRSSIESVESKESDDLYIYQLGNNEWDCINKNYNEMHLGWKTKTAIIPNWKMSDDDLNPFIGASTDIGDKGFIFSFHIHSHNRIKCEQWIKSQKLPFLPYQLLEVWPMYFHQDFNKIDDECTAEYIYKNWKINTNDIRLIKWIQEIDPVFYQTLQKKHLKYQQKK